MPKTERLSWAEI